MASSAVGPARNMTGGVRLPSPIPSLRSIIHFPSSPVPRPYLSGFQLLRAHPRLSKPPVPPLVACCLPRTKGADEEEEEIPAEEGRKQPGMESSQEEEQKYGDGSDGGFGEKLRRGFPAAVKEAMPAKGSAIVAACTIGLLTGVGVVLFNNSVHEIRDLFWDGIPSRGASWLREEPLGGIWQRVILVPVLGGVIVGMLNSLQNILENSSLAIMSSKSKGAIQPVFKAISASITLGTGNSLGPEGPSVEIGASIAKGVGKLLGSEDKGLSLVAAGSAAGISSGFNASVAGCFFAVESVLWPSPADASSSLTNSTSMVILSAVIASVVSEVGLGPVPAFTVPDYDFRSPKLPLYLLLGILCGFVSLTLSSCTSFALEAVNYIQKASGITKSVFPAFGGFAVGLIALAYPEVLYWGFENVDILLESRPFVQGLPADILFQLVGVKIIATSICRASGLVGGYYAPSLFIGAATGVAYGKFMASALSASNALFHLSGLEVASPQAYGLVGMAATLAGVCQVPLTSVLLLFELTQDYRIVLPLLGAVGLSSWITSQNRKISVDDKMDSKKSKFAAARPPSYSSDADNDLASSTSTEAQQTSDLCEIESSLCLYESYTKSLEEKLTISHAMRTRYVTVFLTTSLNEAVTLMLKEKQSCAVIVDNGNLLVGLLTLRNLERFCREPGIIDKQVDKLLVSDLCNLDGYKCQARSITPETTLYSARKIMDLHGIEELPVISESTQGRPAGYLIGLLDRESIDIACRASAAKALLSLYEKEP